MEIFWALVPLFLIIFVVSLYTGWEVYKVVKQDFNFTGFEMKDVSDIFEEIPGDPDNVIMNLPPEVCKAANLKPGDTVSVESLNGSLVIKKVKNG